MGSAPRARPRLGVEPGRGHASAGDLAAVSPHLALAHCLRGLDEIEDDDVRGDKWEASPVPEQLPEQLGDWALVTSHYERRQVRARFGRAGPMPAVVVDADAVTRGKPDPEGYRLAARRLAIAPADGLKVEDGRRVDPGLEPG